MALELGKSVVDFSLPGVDGKTYSPADFADKPVLVVAFWCNHCPYVKAYEDRTIALAREFAGQVAFVAINANDAVKYPEDSYENMQARAKEKGYPFPYLHDESQEVARAYGATRTPEFFVFDQSRVLRYHGRLDDNWENPSEVRQQYLRDALNALLNGQEPPVAQTEPVGCTVKWK
ncbi:MAG: thioredoxin family protein [Armatimonadota bacterium]|nr:thioredoxin family protein [bacterium]MDW8319811.1 thioredoxin family protein [Armatimonadota bacterium]